MSKTINLDNLSYYDNKIKDYITKRISLEEDTSVKMISDKNDSYIKLAPSCVEMMLYSGIDAPGYQLVVGGGSSSGSALNSFTVGANGQIWARSTAWLPKVANGSASIGLSNNGFTFADSTDSGVTFTANDLRTALSSSGVSTVEWTTHVQAHYMDHGEVVPPTFTCSDFYDREFKIIIETYESSMIASSSGGALSSTIITFDDAAYTFSPIYYEGTPMAIRYTDIMNGMPKIHMTVPVLVKNNNSITLQLIDTESGNYIQDTGYCPAINIFILSRSTNMY